MCEVKGSGAQAAPPAPPRSPVLAVVGQAAPPADPVLWVDRAKVDRLRLTGDGSSLQIGAHTISGCTASTPTSLYRVKSWTLNVRTSPDGMCFHRCDESCVIHLFAKHFIRDNQGSPFGKNSHRLRKNGQERFNETAVAIRRRDRLSKAVISRRPGADVPELHQVPRGNA
jgi:hypothetical protein